MYSRSPSKFMSKQKILVLSCAKGCILRKRAYSMRKENNLRNTRFGRERCVRLGWDVLILIEKGIWENMGGQELVRTTETF